MLTETAQKILQHLAHAGATRRRGKGPQVISSISHVLHFYNSATVTGLGGRPCYINTCQRILNELLVINE